MIVKIENAAVNKLSAQTMAKIVKVSGVLIENLIK